MTKTIKESTIRKIIRKELIREAIDNEKEDDSDVNTQTNNILGNLGTKILNVLNQENFNFKENEQQYILAIVTLFFQVINDPLVNHGIPKTKVNLMSLCDDVVNSLDATKIDSFKYVLQRLKEKCNSNEVRGRQKGLTTTFSRPDITNIEKRK